MENFHGARENQWELRPQKENLIMQQERTFQRGQIKYNVAVISKRRIIIKMKDKKNEGIKGSVACSL